MGHTNHFTGKEEMGHSNRERSTNIAPTSMFEGCKEALPTFFLQLFVATFSAQVFIF